MESTGERFIPGWEGTAELEHLNRYYFAINQIDLKDKKVLDIASGEGYGSEILSRYAQNVIGVDISLEAVEYAKAKYINENLKFIQGDATKIPLEDNSVDVVVSFETIEHHDKHTEMISEITRVLKAQGILIISSPDKYYYSDLLNRKNEYHVKELYYSEFRNLISNSFRNVFFFSQRTFSGSIIALDQNHNSYNKPLVVEPKGLKHPFLPMYNIAIASNDLKFEIFEQTICYTEEVEAITRSDIEYAISLTAIKIKKTKTWKIGRFILYPYRQFKKVINKKL
jgi:ubiquinone/menaquinone biosynthesis C-methylase UbiE